MRVKASARSPGLRSRSRVTSWSEKASSSASSKRGVRASTSLAESRCRTISARSAPLTSASWSAASTRKSQKGASSENSRSRQSSAASRAASTAARPASSRSSNKTSGSSRRISQQASARSTLATAGSTLSAQAVRAWRPPGGSLDGGAQEGVRREAKGLSVVQEVGELAEALDVGPETVGMSVLVRPCLAWVRLGGDSSCHGSSGGRMEIRGMGRWDRRLRLLPGYGTGRIPAASVRRRRAPNGPLRRLS